MAVSSKLLLLVMITLIFIPVPSSQFQNHNHTKLEPVHIDHIPSSTKFHNHNHRFLVRMQRDVKTGWLPLHTSSLPPKVMRCYKQVDPVFNPATSTSYTVVPCGSSVCDALLLNDGRCHVGKCGYEVNYADGSYTKGTLMLETLTFGQTRIC
ncbi:hypothetical protein Ddye_030565 [Dipteronia dyeriana]|uniref:Peptidase A1 domain-containing protein n=1 Tax=Dipteronia dyeriana TaxID=168575 RepID=A0AAD9TH60_9ROSI|nr:hypothetical protein Ddye_030565 [Dipteronia dyeriana]